MISKKIYELRRKLEKYIEENDLKAGERLPSEAALSSLFEVSRPTLRECLKVFQKEGILVTINGSGTYPCDNSCHLSNTINELLGTGDLIRLSGYKESADIVEIDLTEPEDEWRAVFGSQNLEKVAVIKRIRKADDKKVAMAWNIFPENYIDYNEIKPELFATVS